MTCAWKELLGILPGWLKSEVDKYSQILRELRLRLDKSAQLKTAKGYYSICREVTGEDLSFIVNAACRYSPWTATGAAQGYITAPGGHRIGLCGEAVIQNGTMTGLRSITSLNIRVARDFPGIAEPLAKCSGSVLILGKPGSGKTTLLRDFIRQRSYTETVAVVDERGELFPVGFDKGTSVDILTGCPKAHGLDAVLRTMGPDTVAIDEITAEADCRALLRAGWCGVHLLATAHASCRQDLMSRAVYRPLLEAGLFEHLVTLQPDKSFRTERMNL